MTRKQFKEKTEVKAEIPPIPIDRIILDPDYFRTQPCDDLTRFSGGRAMNLDVDRNLDPSRILNERRPVGFLTMSKQPAETAQLYITAVLKPKFEFRFIFCDGNIPLKTRKVNPTALLTQYTLYTSKMKRSAAEVHLTHSQDIARQMNPTASFEKNQIQAAQLTDSFAKKAFEDDLMNTDMVREQVSELAIKLNCSIEQVSNLDMSVYRDLGLVMHEALTIRGPDHDPRPLISNIKPVDLQKAVLRMSRGSKRTRSIRKHKVTIR